MDYINILKNAQRFLSRDIRFNPLTQMDVCKKNTLQETVKNQFAKFSKEDDEINTLIKGIKSINNVRCAHIIFTFLFGIYIYNKCEKIKKAVNKEVLEMLLLAGHPDDFSFLWFLICLFHDLGYTEENSQHEDRVGPCWACNSKKLGAVDGVPEFYSKIYKNYFLYRKIEHGKTDHGIYAGLKMYPNLCRIRKNKANSPNGGWRQQLKHVYNYASWVVLAHNVYFTKDTKSETCALYRKYSLEDLILETEGDSIKNYPIKQSEHSVLFLFCLVDLIEPMKRIEEIECCDKIKFEICEDRIIISSDLDCTCVKNYLKGILDAKDWFAKVEQEDKRIIIPLQ